MTPVYCARHCFALSLLSTLLCFHTRAGDLSLMDLADEAQMKRVTATGANVTLSRVRDS